MNVVKIPVGRITKNVYIIIMNDKEKLFHEIVETVARSHN